MDMEWLKNKLESKKQAIEDEVCNLCGEAVLSFEDPISEREYAISGTCQNCQNEVFNKDPFVGGDDEL